MELFQLTQALVNIESVTGHERACTEFLQDYLAARKFQVDLQPVSRERSNVFARRGKPEIVLSTHLDTVPPFFPAHEDADFIYGRGACDAKGIVAAQIAAAERLRAEGQKAIGLLYVVDEEAGSLGAKVANGHAAAAGVKYVVVGEPTENRLAAGCMGSLRLSLATAGIAAH